MQKSSVKFKPIRELEWYYRQSAAEVGLRACAYEPHPTVLFQPTAPSGGEMSAARRQSRVRTRLAYLIPHHRWALEQAYVAKRLSAQLTGQFDLAAGIVDAMLKASVQRYEIEAYRLFNLRKKGAEPDVILRAEEAVRRAALEPKTVLADLGAEAVLMLLDAQESYLMVKEWLEV